MTKKLRSDILYTPIRTFEDVNFGDVIIVVKFLRYVKRDLHGSGVKNIQLYKTFNVTENKYVNFIEPFLRPLK